jgi:hypothetical protein
MLGDMIPIDEAKDKILKDLRVVSEFMSESNLFDSAIGYVTSLSKGALPKNSFHEDGLERAKSNLDILKSGDGKNIDSIKKEAALSLKELENTPKNTEQEMDEYVKNYNLDL